MDVPNSATRYAVGTNFSSTSLNGFELSDLTIDANLGAAGTAATTGAVGVRGSNIYVHRVKVINYGAKASGAEFNVLTAAGDDSENCVVEE